MESWRHFSRAASTYGQVSSLQRDIGKALLGLLPGDLKPKRVLDLGCGDGEGTEALRERFPGCELEGWDRAPGMVRLAMARPGITVKEVDMDDPRVGEGPAFSLIHTNLAVQWTRDPGALLGRLHRLLEPEGYLALSVFLADSGEELTRAAAAAAVPLTRGPGFTTANRWGDLLFQNGFTGFYTGLFKQKETFDDGRALLAHLRAMGAHTGTAAALTPGRYRALVEGLGKPAVHTWSWALFIARNMGGGT